MRLFEIFLMVAITFSLINLISIKNFKLKALLSITSIGFSTISVIFEGFRLAMIPAYLLSIMLLLIFTIRTLRPNAKRRKILNRIGVTFLILIFALSIGLEILLPVINLPKPTGSYFVGSTRLAFTDFSRKGIITNTDEYRKVPVQIWYPASTIDNKKRLNWINNDAIESFSKCKRIPNILGQLSLIKTNSYFDAELSSEEEKYPLIVFSGGSAMFNGQNVIQMEELASHGYIVCAVGHPYDDFACIYPDDSIVEYNQEHLSALGGEVNEAIALVKKEFGGDDADPAFGRNVLRNCKTNNADVSIWSEDMVFVANELTKLNNSSNNIFKGKLDISKMGIFGHSFGGAAAGEACLHDERFKGFINLDGSPFGTAVDNVIQQPFMVLTVGKDEKRIISSAYSEKQKNFTTVYIEGAEHMNFSDFNTILPNIGKAI